MSICLGCRAPSPVFPATQPPSPALFEPNSLPSHSLGYRAAQVEHVLRLVLIPEEKGAKEAWNSLPIKLVRARLSGGERGSVVPKTAPKGQKYWWLIFGIVFALFSIATNMFPDLADALGVPVAGTPHPGIPGIPSSYASPATDEDWDADDDERPEVVIDGAEASFRMSR